MMINNNKVLFSMKNENQSDSVQIQGIQMLVKDLRVKIKERLSRRLIFLSFKLGMVNNSDRNVEELQIFDDAEQILTIGDKVRSNERVIVIRLPGSQANNLCKSCFWNKSTMHTPCCQIQICQRCDQRFSQASRCAFNEKKYCQLNYVNHIHYPEFQKPEISVQELDKAIQDAVFYIVKSNNEFNVQHAQKYNIWATTQKNFKRLLQAFNQNKQVNKMIFIIFMMKVILIFTANRADRFLGCAKMINTYSSYQKTQWQGAQNILLADNFGIEWLRKGSLDFSRVQDIVNPQTGESITKSRDCQEVPKVMINVIYIQTCIIFKTLIHFYLGYWQKYLFTI